MREFVMIHVFLLSKNPHSPLIVSSYVCIYAIRVQNINKLGHTLKSSRFKILFILTFCWDFHIDVRYTHLSITIINYNNIRCSQLFLYGIIHFSWFTEQKSVDQLGKNEVIYVCKNSKIEMLTNYNYSSARLPKVVKPLADSLRIYSVKYRL